MDSLVKPFVDFYRNNGISPVAQDISDLRAHFARREALYRQLGLPPRFLGAREIIEFGPGSGYNALYTASLQPSRYVLVDANPVGLSRARELLQPYWQDGQYTLVPALVEEYSDDRLYDVVICEGVIPFQLRPAEFARSIARFASAGGIVIVTTIDPLSFLSETIRRLMAAIVTEGYVDDVSVRLERLRPFFAPHLETLRARSRPVDDWILDNVLNPFIGKTFSIPEAIDALSDEFDFYGSSPDFVRDWRWYKDAGLDLHGVGRRAKEEYLRAIGTLVDYRFEPPAVDIRRGEAALHAATRLYEGMQLLEREGDVSRIPVLAQEIDEIADVLPLEPTTIAAMRQARAFIDGSSSELSAFKAWFGRGQQFVSFVRRGA